MTVRANKPSINDPGVDSARLFETVVAGKRMWEQTFDAINCGIVVRDQNDRIARCNQFAAEMLNLEPAQVIGLCWSDTFIRLFGARNAPHLQDWRGAAVSFEAEAEDDRRYLISFSPLDMQEQACVIVWNDVTELAEMQEQLARSRRLATVGRLAAGVAHEINNPLASITACAEAAIRALRRATGAPAHDAEPEWVPFVEEIIRQAFRCKAITKGLLDLSAQRSPVTAACDINLLAAECLKTAERLAANERVSFNLYLSAEAGETATDSIMVRQILDNLLSNAIDALGPHEGTITLTSVRDGPRVSIEVADTGPGIAPEQLARIFDPFFTTKDPGKGSGLGLAVSYALAENLGGTLTVESTPGKGSKFRLWLPRRAPEKQETG